VIGRRCRPLAQILAGDRSGLAMVEFALLLPALLVLTIGAYETANLLMVNLKLASASETAADLVAQTEVNYVLQSSDFTNITNAAEMVMTPFPTGSSQMEIAYASITYSTGAPVIDWHTEVNGATAISVASLPYSVSAANLGNETAGSTDSVIVVQLTYAYTSPYSYVLNTSYSLSSAAFNRPRYVSCVPSYLNNNNICP
jgi:Flp pilus assembly protein TadG